ncbi:MAG TPA: SMC-Scp complex subunit ScpB, partial [Gammaproteobacteria bacterium]|nr:SMC-Scp complex subunit ScpB [Gammaproteobacteria bacterium]
DPKQQLRIIEGALFASDKPLTVHELGQIFTEEERPSNAEIKALLTEITAIYAERGLQLQHLASGYCFRVSADLAPWVSRLWEARPPRYSRALMETLAVIAYRQPVTRGDIEQIRGVNVSPGTIKTLLDREWIQIVGHREVPGRPELMATTAQFLDYFGLRTIEELPTLMAIKEIDATVDDAEKILQADEAASMSHTEDEQLSLLEMKTSQASTLMLSAPVEHSEAQ